MKQLRIMMNRGHKSCFDEEGREHFSRLDPHAPLSAYMMSIHQLAHDNGWCLDEQIHAWYTAPFPLKIDEFTRYYIPQCDIREGLADTQLILYACDAYPSHTINVIVDLNGYAPLKIADVKNEVRFEETTSERAATLVEALIRKKRLRLLL